MAVASRSSLNADHSSDIEDLTDPVKEIVFLLAECHSILAGALLIEQLFGSRGTRSGRQLFGKIIGELDEFFVGGHGCALAHQFHHGTFWLIGTTVETKPPEACLPVTPFRQNLSATLTQQLDSLILVSTCFSQCRFTVHHGQARLFSQSHNSGGSYFGHLYLFSFIGS